MQSASMLLIAIFAPIVAYGFICAYRLVCATVADVMLLVLLTGAAMGAGYLFG